MDFNFSNQILEEKNLMIIDITDNDRVYDKTAEDEDIIGIYDAVDEQKLLEHSVRENKERYNNRRQSILYRFGLRRYNEEENYQTSNVTTNLPPLPIFPDQTVFENKSENNTQNIPLTINPDINTMIPLPITPFPISEITPTRPSPLPITTLVNPYRAQNVPRTPFRPRPDPNIRTHRDFYNPNYPLAIRRNLNDIFELMHN